MRHGVGGKLDTASALLIFQLGRLVGVKDGILAASKLGSCPAARRMLLSESHDCLQLVLQDSSERLAATRVNSHLESSDSLTSE
jgi:hypothetical protein